MKKALLTIATIVLTSCMSAMDCKVTNKWGMEFEDKRLNVYEVQNEDKNYMLLSIDDNKPVLGDCLHITKKGKKPIEEFLQAYQKEINGEIAYIDYTAKVYPIESYSIIECD